LIPFLANLIPESNRLDVAFSRAAGNASKTHLLEACYSPGAGFVGAFSEEDDDSPEWARRAAAYMNADFLDNTPGTKKLFGDVSRQLAVGDGECHINTRYALEAWAKNGKVGVEPFTNDQDYGSCIDCAGGAEGGTALIGFRAAKMPQVNEIYKHPAAWYFYGDRGYCSDGWGNGGLSAVARRRGLAFRTKYDLPGGSVDFTDDNKNEQIVARQWCRSGIPSWIYSHTSANHAFEDGAITQFEGSLAEMKKAFAAGGIILTSGTRTSGGSKPFTPGSVGPHAQTAYGYDDSDEFRRFCQDVIGVRPRDNDFPITMGQTWGSGWSGECADRYWPAWWGPKPQGAWVCWASWLEDALSLDYVWLPWVKGFPNDNPLPPPTQQHPVITGTLYADQLASGGIAIRGDLQLNADGKFDYIVIPDGPGRYKPIPRPVV
jgi:hypothetical protein